MTLLELYDIITRGGLPAVFLVILWAGSKRLWVYGWQYDNERRRADRFEEIALTSTKIASKVTDVVEANHSERTSRNGPAEND